MGDLIEIEGINEVFQSSHSPDRPLVIGAGKTCVGHGEIVAGLIGVLKALVSFTDNTVPGLVQLTAENMNPSLDCSLVPLHIPIEPAVIETEDGRPLRSLILYVTFCRHIQFIYLSFFRSNGFAGSIAGAILEGPSKDMQPRLTTPIPENVPMMFVVSAKSQDALNEYLENYLDFCLSAPESMFHSICYTTCVGREHYRYRFACVAHNMQDLITRIEERLQNESSSSAGNAKRILLGFPGQGSQYQGMGRYLSNQFSGFLSIITSAADKASALTGYPILTYLLEEVPATTKLTIDHSEVAPICIFVFQYTMATWLESIGLQAHAVLGHSLGEIAGAGQLSQTSFSLTMVY